MRYQLQRTQQLSADLDTVWNFFSSPFNLSRITPKEMNFVVLNDIKEGSIFEGMLIDYKVSPLLGIPMKWTTLITQVQEKISFTDFQQSGPYKLWNHFHEFIPNEKGVLIKDTVDYELPLGFLGDMMHTWMVNRKLNHIFNYRQQVLEKLFNS